MNKNEKFVPEIISPLRSKTVAVPKSIYKASGIMILKKRIKSLVFSTDVSIISNCNADAVMAVYPFTPTMAISQSIIQVASNPTFVGVGGGLTSGARVINLAMHADFLGAYGIVVNSPIPNEIIREMNEVLDIPIIASVVSFNDDIEGKINAGADILNVSGGKNTIELVKFIRSKVGNDFPIIATGGPTEELITQTIEAGANAITFTPPSSGEIFSKIMQNYRNIKREENK